jgi:hypothetical protein
MARRLPGHAICVVCPKEDPVEAKPVRRYAPPGYPTRRELLTRPAEEHLAFGVPWPLGPGVAAAVGLLLAGGLAGCVDRGPGTTAPPADAPPGAATAPTPASRPGVKLARTVVAPLFLHGSGRGATGCVIMTPPVFLSEEEALLVIREELALHGIELGPGGRKLGDIQVAPRVRRRLDDGSLDSDWLDFVRDRGVVPIPDKAAALEIDAEDPRQGVAIEFVSVADYRALGGIGSEVELVDERGQVTGGISSSVEDYDFRDAAQYVVAEARRQGLTPMRLGVFYDPFTQSADEDEARRRSRDLLRQQAQDFARWLRLQGVR